MAQVVTIGLVWATQYLACKLILSSSIASST
jgi:hypothetical protein